MLPVSQRIGKDSLTPVLASGVVFHSPHFTIRVKTASRNAFAALVSKKVAKSAVDRNRTRRRVYSAIRDLIPHLQTKHYVVVSAKNSSTKLPFVVFKEEIQTLFKKAGVV